MSALRVLGSALIICFSFHPAFSFETEAAAEPPTAPEILARWAEAVGGTRLKTIESVYTHGVYDGTYGHGINEEWHTRKGQRIQRNVVDSGERIHVFDGKEGWTRNRLGQVRELSAREQALQADLAVVGSLAYLVPGADTRLRFEFLGVDDSGCCYLLRMTSVTGSSSTWYIDRETSLPVKQVGGLPLNFTIEFNGWREIDGIKLPAQLIITASTGYRSTETLQAARFNLPLAADFFSRPKEGPRRSSLVKGQSARDLPIVQDNGQVFVQGKVNGAGPVWITLDTGASSAAIDSACAQRLGVKVSGELPANGAGGSETAGMAGGINFDLPGVAMVNQSAGVLPLEFLSRRVGRSVCAILGYEFFHSFVVDIDFAGQRMSLHDPERFRYDGPGDVIPLQLDGELPYVEAAVRTSDGRVATGTFVVDLGSQFPVILEERYSEKHKLVEGIGPTIRLQGRGVGGVVEIIVARIQEIQIGRATVAAPIAAFPQNMGGSITGEGSVGNLGATLLRHFRVIFDYSRNRMILERGADFDEPFEYDMSGLSLLSAGPDFTEISVARVLPNSPGEAAGIQVGDFVEAVNGVKVSDLKSLRQTLREPGREVELRLRRGETSVVAKFALRRLV